MMSSDRIRAALLALCVTLLLAASFCLALGAARVGIAKAALPPCGEGQVVQIAYADDNGPPTDLRSQILAEPGVTGVDLFDAMAATPSLAQLEQYNVVVPFSNRPFQDSITLGNNLADYVDAGGTVVQFGFSFYGPGQPYGINGRWLTGNYSPYDYSLSDVTDSPFTLGTHDSSHPLMAGVTTLSSNFQNVVTPASGATEVAAASNGNSLVAYRNVSGGHTTVGVTAYVGANATETGDWGRVVANAGKWLCPAQPSTPTTPTTPPTPSSGKDPKCAKLRKKLKHQKQNLAKARSDSKRAMIQANIADTQKRLKKLAC
jgi:hypothetical protein